MTVHELGYEMDTYLDEACETAVVDANMESEPFLASIPSSTTSWVAPKGFIWIEIGKKSSITAPSTTVVKNVVWSLSLTCSQQRYSQMYSYRALMGLLQRQHML